MKFKKHKIVLGTLALFAFFITYHVASALSLFQPYQGGTGVGTITGVIKGNGTAAFSAAGSSDLITTLGYTPLNATGATVGATSQQQAFTNGINFSAFSTIPYDGDQWLMGNTDASKFRLGGYATASGTINTLLGGSDFAHYYFAHNVNNVAGVMTAVDDVTSTSYMALFSDNGKFNTYKAPAGATAVWNTTPTFSLDMVSGHLGIGATPLGLADFSGSSSSTSIAFDSNRAISVINTDQTVGNMGGLDFRTADGAGTIVTGAKIMGIYNSHTVGTVTSDLAFLTNNLGTVGERMRINANGAVNITGATLNTDANLAYMGMTIGGSITKNDANTRTFYGVNINPTINAGVSNSNTTFNVLNIDTTNTSLQGVTLNLLRIGSNGTAKLTFNNAGNMVITAVTTSGTSYSNVTNSLTTGIAQEIISSSNILSSGQLLTVTKVNSNSSVAFTGDVANISYAQTFNGGIGLDSTANMLDVSRNVILNNAGNTHTISGALATLSDSGTQTAGTLTHTANVLSISQNYAAASGTVLFLNSVGSGLLMDLQASGVSKFKVSNIGNITIGGQSAKTILEARNVTANTAGNDLTIQAGGATVAATDKDAGMVVITPGISTGTGKSSVRIQSLTRAASTATADNTLEDRIIVPAVKNLTNTAAIGLFEVSLPTLETAGGTIDYTIKATDGTDMHSISGTVIYDVVNKGGVYTQTIDQTKINTVATSNTGGTNVPVFSITTGTNKFTVIVTDTDSLTPTTQKIRYTIHNNSGSTITQL